MKLTLSLLLALAVTFPVDARAASVTYVSDGSPFNFIRAGVFPSGTHMDARLVFDDLLPTSCDFCVFAPIEASLTLIGPNFQPLELNLTNATFDPIRLTLTNGTITRWSLHGVMLCCNNFGGLTIFDASFSNSPSASEASTATYYDAAASQGFPNVCCGPASAQGGTNGPVRTWHQVPEPSSLVLLAVGLVVVTARWQFLKRRAPVVEIDRRLG